MKRLALSLRLRWRLWLAKRTLRDLPTAEMRERTARYAEFLSGRKVAIVGPAPTTQGTGQGTRIDDMDVVVRLNHALPVPEALDHDIGTRTDVLYHNLYRGNPRAIAFEELVPLLQANCRWVCSAYPYLRLDHDFTADIDAFRAVLGDRVPLHIPDARRYLETTRALMSRPNAGVSAILDLLSFEIRELYITGFSFYVGPSWYQEGYRGAGPSLHHNPSAQRKLFAARAQSDSRIVLDEPLKRILEA